MNSQVIQLGHILDEINASIKSVAVDVSVCERVIVCVHAWVCACVCMHVHAISLCLVTKKMLPTAQWIDQEKRFDSAPIATHKTTSEP